MMSVEVIVCVCISVVIDNEYVNCVLDFLLFDKLDIGVCELIFVEVWEVLVDVEFNVDIKGGFEEMLGGICRVYVVFVKQFCKVIVVVEVKVSFKGKLIVMQVWFVGLDYQVVMVVGGWGIYCWQLCSDCLWWVDVVGEFLVEVFWYLVGVVYDMSQYIFVCYQLGQK